jgi:D-arabinose 1-dehydrogenase-like Zn-dependent alcohol dehydrogenase
MGLKDRMRESCRAAAFEGTVAVIGVVQTLRAEFDIFDVMNKNLRVRGVETGSRAMFERMIQFMEQRAMHPVVESVFGTGQVAEAFGRLKQSPFGKVVIDMLISREAG